MLNRTRAISAAAIAVTLAAGTTAAAAATTTDKPAATKTGKAATTTTKGGKPGPGTRIKPPAGKNGSNRTGDDALAARLGVSPDRLEQALRAAKMSLAQATGALTPSRFDAALAQNLGLPRALVRRAMSGPEPSGSKRAQARTSEHNGQEAFAAAVAQALHVSTARAEAALRPLFAAGRADSSSPVFVAAARSLHVSPQQLTTAVGHAKQSLAGTH